MSMTTLIDTIRPSEAYIESIIPQALGINSTDTWIDIYLKGLVSRIMNDPKLYRLYGPWWPAIKEILLERGEVRLGQTNASDVADIYRMSRPELTLLAGHLYSEERLDIAIFYDDTHWLDVAEYADDTEPYLYVSNDESLEKYQI